MDLSNSTVQNVKQAEMGKMTTFDLCPIPWGAWGMGCRDKYVSPAIMNRFLPLLATQIPTLWIHTSGGGL
jgi:hypothetical protein